MKSDKLMLELEEIVNQLGYRVRYERGSFRSDSCVIEGDKLIVINKNNPVELQVGVLANLLENKDLENIYLKPVVRKELETYWKRKNKFEQGDLNFGEEQE
ncbi:MAG TPA: hypothetical protein VKA34_18735 [Balneolales bacterium]|nr:hypothetical protein [Balneolales bacterium]